MLRIKWSHFQNGIYNYNWKFKLSFDLMELNWAIFYLQLIWVMFNEYSGNLACKYARMINRLFVYTLNIYFFKSLLLQQRFTLGFLDVLFKYRIITCVYLVITFVTTCNYTQYFCWISLNYENSPIFTCGFLNLKMNFST